MGDPIRVTQPLLDILEILLETSARGEQVHGWALTRATKRSGPTVYGVLDRLEDAQWVTSTWEDQDEAANRPRRRLYRLTPTGTIRARKLVTERRPRPASGLCWPGLPAAGNA